MNKLSAFLIIGVVTTPVFAQTAQQLDDVTIELTIAGNILIMPFEVAGYQTINSEVEYRSYRERDSRVASGSINLKRGRIHGSYSVVIDPWRSRSTVGFHFLRWPAESGVSCALSKVSINASELPVVLTLNGGHGKDCDVDVFIGRDLGDYIEAIPTNPSNKNELGSGQRQSF